MKHLAAILGRPRWVLPAVALVNALIVWNFHDQHWYVIDEGNYAHIAERMLAGDVLHLEVQDLHPGYVNFVNAAAFALFGIDLVSLRYPLALLAFLQSLLVWALLVRRDVLLAAIASLSASALGFIQFLDPTAHWYALFVTIALVCWLAWAPKGHPARVLGAGVLLGILTLFRQLTGVWVAMAVLVILMREEPQEARGRDTAFGRGLVLLMLAAVLSYLAFAGGPEAGGVLLIASWPIAILALTFRDLRPSNRAVFAILLRIGAGAAAAAIPVVAYHAIHGSLAAWIDDVVFAALALTALPFFDHAWIAVLPLAALVQTVMSLDPVAIVNGLYWMVLPLAAAVNGVITLRLLRRTDVELLILPLVAAFYALVTLHLASPVYLYYTVGLSMAAILWWASFGARRRRLLCAATAAGVSIVAVGFHAGQSSFRRPPEFLRGHRTVTAQTVTCPGFARSSLRIEWAECEPYHRLVGAIEREAPAGAHIFALPSDAELYFLANRPNLFRFYNTALGIRTPRDLDHVLSTLKRQPPHVVTYRPGDKYNTPASDRIMELVRSTYEKFDTIAGVELYRPRTPAGVETGP